MPRPHLACAIALAALGAFARAADAPAPLKFAWPVPSKGTVTEKIQKAGHVATTRYVVSLERSGDAGDLRLHLGDFEFVELDGKPASDAAVAEQVRMALPIAKAIPDLLIGADGAVKEVLGIDAAIKTMIEEIEKSADERQKASMAAVRAQLDSPDSKEKIRRETIRYWVAWVCDWAGRSIPEGEVVAGRYPVRCPDSTEVDAPAQFRRMPGGPDRPGLVRISRECVLDGDDAKPAFDAWMKQVTQATGRTVPATGMRLGDRALTIADPATLRPVVVLREETRTLHMKDAADRNDVERHEYTFVWTAAEAPKPAK